MKNKKFIMIMMMTAVIAAGSTGCEKRADTVGQPVAATEERVESTEIEDKGDTKVEDTETAKPELEAARKEELQKEEVQTEEEVVAEQTVEETGASAFDGELSEDWTDMQFVFDGNSYELPASYRELEQSGWSFDLAKYGYSDGYILNPGDKTYDTIELSNPAYDEDITVWVGFINTSDTAKDILDCEIWSIQLDTCKGFTQVENHPDMKVAKGIGIGSSREEVEAAFGPCDDIYEADGDCNYVTYNYEVDYTYHLKLTIYDDKGVTAIAMSSYER